MIEFEDYIAQDNTITFSSSSHTDVGHDDHDDHDDHTDTWVDEGDQDYGHSGHCDVG